MRIHNGDKGYHSLSDIATEGMVFQLELYCNDRMIASLALPEYEHPVVFEQVEPGAYSLKLSNGRVLWQGAVASTDVIWAAAFPQKKYPMAAQTERDSDDQTRSFEILDGELCIALYAGLETGRLEVKRERR